MIYEFALEPELVATWHDARVAYSVVSQIGPGHSRVACRFPSRTWELLVVAALQAFFPDRDSPAAQGARKHLEILLRHLAVTGTTRSGEIAHGETWFSAAQREHGRYPFGGIVVRSSDLKRDYLVIVDRLGVEEFPAWTRPAPPVPRTPRDLADALAPLLRCAGCIRFIDPYFDVGVDAYLEPMKEYLLAAQQRRDVDRLQLEIHFAINSWAVDQARRAGAHGITETQLAQQRVEVSRDRMMPLLRPGVTLRICAWRDLVEDFHNRYVLTDVGGVLLGSGLDRARPGAKYTDDLLILSNEQRDARWRLYSRGIADLKLLAEWDGRAR